MRVIGVTANTLSQFFSGRMWYLSYYGPETSDIEPIWQALKHHEVPVLSYSDLKVMKQAAGEVLVKKARNGHHTNAHRLLCSLRTSTTC